MQNSRRPQPFLMQIWDLFLVELTNWRLTWQHTVVLGTITPLLSMFSFSIFARDSGPEALEFIWSGNVLISLMFGLQNRLAMHFVYLRLEGMLNYFATLPIKKSALILAIISAFFLIALPSTLGTIFLGAWILGLSINPSPLLMIVVPLCAIPVGGIGALIGSRARNYNEAGSIDLITTFIMLAVGPVLFPPDILPNFLLVLGRFSPATYAASALRAALSGTISPTFWLDLGVLALISVMIIGIVGRTLDWREA